MFQAPCPHCENTNRVSEKSSADHKCVNCGKFMKDRMCPRCNCGLLVRELCGVEIDICSRCGGIWFDKGEISRISMRSSFETRDSSEKIKSALAVLRKRDVRGSLPQTHEGIISSNLKDSGETPCPACPRVLHTMDYEGVEIDVCSRCRGIWLDHGELEELMNRFDTSVLTGKAGWNKGQISQAAELLSVDYLKDTLNQAALRRRKRLADQEFDHLRKAASRKAGPDTAQGTIVTGKTFDTEPAILETGLACLNVMDTLSDGMTAGAEVIAQETAWCIVEAVFEYLAEIVIDAIGS